MTDPQKDLPIDIRDAFFDELYEIARRDTNVIFMTADMGAHGLEKFKCKLPRQYINVGIAEQNLVSVGAGLALSGKKVFIYAIASFVTQRCYEQIRVDLCGMNLPVVIIGSGPGICYGSDGSTHHAIEDIAMMRTLPHLTILNPSDPASAAASARMSYAGDTPSYIRLDKGTLPLLYPAEERFTDGLTLLRKGGDLLLIATGIMVHHARTLADELAKHSIDAGILDLYRIKPLNQEFLASHLRSSRRIATIEEHTLAGGIGSAVCEVIADLGLSIRVKRFALAEPTCARYGDRKWLYGYHGLDISTLCEQLCTQN